MSQGTSIKKQLVDKGKLNKGSPTPATKGMLGRNSPNPVNKEESAKSADLPVSQENVDKGCICMECKMEVKGRDKGVNCETCENWFHIQCQEISIETYNVMMMEESKVLHWFCSSCEAETLSVGKVIHSIKIRQDNIEKDLSSLKADVLKQANVNKHELDQLKRNFSEVNVEVSALSKRVCSLDDNFTKDIVTKGEVLSLIDKRMTEHLKEVKKDVEVVKNSLKDASENNKTGSISSDELASIVAARISDYDKQRTEKESENEPKWSDIVSKHVNKKFEEVKEDITVVTKVLDETKLKASEEKDRESRANNIIIYRVPECANSEERGKHDKQFCMDLLKQILEVDIREEDIVKVFRLGKKKDNDHNRPVLIQLRERGTKNRIMESLYKLKSADDKFRNVSISHDLTQIERTECKTLVEEAKKRQSEEQGEYIWRVRGLPGQLKILKIHKKQ